MLVLAAVPEVQLLKLRRAAGLRFALAHARTWSDALTTIRTRPVELAVGVPLLARGAADGATGGRARPRRPAHLRALVPAARAAVAAPLPRRRPRAARAPAAAGSGVHRGRRGTAARLRPDQDAAAARPRLPRAHPGRDARRARRAGGAATRGAWLCAPEGAGLRVLNVARSTFHVPRFLSPESRAPLLHRRHKR